MASKKQNRDYYHQLLTVVFEFMLLSGMRPKEVQRLAANALGNVRRTKQGQSRRRQTELLVASLVLERWHRSRLYVDKDANPKPIPLRGVAPSVEALLRAEGQKGDPSDLIRRMKSQGMIVRCGPDGYRPATRIVVVPELDPIMQQHIVRAMWLLLKTAKRNLEVTENSKGLVERRAEIPDLPTKYVPEFRAFAKLQAIAMLERINDWLEVRRARRLKASRRNTVGAGMHVFAYLDDHRRK